MPPHAAAPGRSSRISRSAPIASRFIDASMSCRLNLACSNSPVSRTDRIRRARQAEQDRGAGTRRASRSGAPQAVARRAPPPSGRRRRSRPGARPARPRGRRSRRRSMPRDSLRHVPLRPGGGWRPFGRRRRRTNSATATATQRSHAATQTTGHSKVGSNDFLRSRARVPHAVSGCRWNGVRLWMPKRCPWCGPDVDDHGDRDQRRTAAPSRCCAGRASRSSARSESSARAYWSRKA